MKSEKKPQKSVYIQHVAKILGNNELVWNDRSKQEKIQLNLNHTTFYETYLSLQPEECKLTKKASAMLLHQPFINQAGKQLNQQCLIHYSSAV